MPQKFVTQREQIVKLLAKAGAETLDFMGAASVLAPIPHSRPQQYVAAGTVQAIIAVLPKDEQSSGPVPRVGGNTNDEPSERMLFEEAFPDTDAWSIEADQVAWKVWQKARAHPAAPVQPVAVPAGYAIVPVESTMEMDDAGHNTLLARGANVEINDAEACWSAMIAAAPSPAAVDGAKGEWQVDDVLPPFAAPASQRDASDTNWLLSTMDGKDWADEFCRMNNAANHGMMLAWFCNAIMTGYDTGRRHEAEEQSRTAGAAKGGNTFLDGWTISETGDVITISHPSIGQAATPRNVTDPADVVLRHLAESLLATQAPAIAADRDAVLEEAALAAEKVQDTYREQQSGKWPELRDDAEIGASSCVDAIRAMKSTSSAASQTNGGE